MCVARTVLSVTLASAIQDFNIIEQQAKVQRVADAELAATQVLWLTA